MTGAYLSYLSESAIRFEKFKLEKKLFAKNDFTDICQKNATPL